MKKYARIVDKKVIEIIELYDQITPKDVFASSLAGQWISISNDFNVNVNDIFDGKTFMAPPSPPPLDIEVVKQNLLKAIDNDAENERLKYITTGIGQSLIYQEKATQAANYSKAYSEYLRDPANNKEPNPNDYLLLQASIGIDGETLIEVAENITSAYALWQKIGAAIETTRLQTKTAIDSAKTIEEAQAIFDKIKWPSF